MRMALPLSGAMLSQALLGLVDTALVGHLGGLALASVSIGSYLVFILAALLTGLGTGLHGYSSHKGVSQTQWLSCGLMLGLVLALLLAAIGAKLAPIAIEAYVLDDRINSLALHYTQWRLWGLPAIVLSLVTRIFWSNKGTPWAFAKVLLLVHLLNIPISYSLIYGFAGIPAMGATGAALGTVISLWLGAGLHVLQIMRGNNPAQSLLALPKHTDFVQLVKFSWPAMVQQLAFALHLAVFLWLLSWLGASAMAASFSVLNVGLLLVLPAIGLGQSAMTLVGSAMAAGNKPLLQQWSKLILQCGMAIAILLAALTWLSSFWLAEMVLISRDLQQLMASALPWYAIAMVFESAIVILTRCLIVVGRRKTTLILVSLGQWLLFLPLMAWLAPIHGFMLVWWLHIAYRMVVALLLWLSWKRFLSLPQRPTQAQTKRH